MNRDLSKPFGWNANPPPGYTGNRVGDIVNHPQLGVCRVVALLHHPERHPCPLGDACKAQWQPVLSPLAFEL